MPNIINPNCPSLPQQVEKNTQDILKLFASNLEELSGLEFIPTSLIYQQDKAIISGKFIVTREEVSTEINGVVTLPIKGENGIIVDGSEDNFKIRIALDQSDRDLFNYVQELVNRTTESDEIVFTSDMENYVEDFVSEATENFEEVVLLYDKDSDDININRGLTSGINDGGSINENFATNYKKLFVEVFGWGAIYGKNVYSVGEFDIDKLNIDSSNGSASTFFTFYESDRMYSYGGMVSCENNTTTFQSKRYTSIGSQPVGSGFPIFRIWGVKR